MILRKNNRLFNELRPLNIIPDFYNYIDGSCLIELGNTKVICAATVEDKVPPFIKGTGKGWLTAEYSMLPKSSSVRVERESIKGKQSGRTQEIQRLIGRSLRACVNLQDLGERQIKIDCDVIQADGGTRTAAITGGYIALSLTLNRMVKCRKLKVNPIINEIAAISCGIINGSVLLDLDYSEDSNAEVDANFVITAKSEIIELQTSAEQLPFKDEQLLTMLSIAKKGINELIEASRKVLQGYENV